MLQVTITFLLLICSGCASLDGALTAAGDREAVTGSVVIRIARQYSQELARIESVSKRQSLEPLVTIGNNLTGHLRDLEELSEKDYEIVERLMRGFFINREEVVFAKPDNEFFLDLANKKGLQADVAYFELRSRIRPDSIWAAYLQPQTDYSGCTLFGNGTLTELYGSITRFRQDFPDAYKDNVKSELDDVVSRLTDGACVCGSRTIVEDEYRSFLKRFPNADISQKVRHRLSTLESDRDFRFNCLSG